MLKDHFLSSLETYTTCPSKVSGVKNYILNEQQQKPVSKDRNLKSKYNLRKQFLREHGPGSLEIDTAWTSTNSHMHWVPEPDKREPEMGVQEIKEFIKRK